MAGSRGPGEQRPRSVVVHSMVNPRFEQLMLEYTAIEAEDAKEAGKLGYLPSAIVQATLPYRNPSPEPDMWLRTNGKVSLAITPGYRIVPDRTIDASGRVREVLVKVSRGYPYGSIPRLLLSWVATEAVRTRSAEIKLGESLTDFMDAFGWHNQTGGKHGSITRLKDQARRLFTADIRVMRNATSHQDHSVHERAYRIASEVYESEDFSPFGATLTLADAFFREIIEHPLPVDMRALSALKQSPLAIDVYSWLTWRMSFLSRPMQVHWEVLMGQFGSQTESPKKFRENFRAALKQVRMVYPQVRVDPRTEGLLLLPSPTSVRKSSR